MKVDKNSYLQFDVNKHKESVDKDPWRLQYHLMPPSGWLNDPNGLCQFHGVYHVYYQYSPNDVEGKTKLWGHYSSKDLITWISHEPVLFEDSALDERGVYSGSAYIEDDEIHYFYTGNVKLDGDFDYINEGRIQNTIYVSSKDGQHFSKKKRLLNNDDYPEDMSCHVRDPKVFKVKDHYFMVIGARDRNSHGCVLVYRSSTLWDWTYAFRIQNDEFGYMWECPDLFELDGQYFLMTCPQGLETCEYRYENIYQNGYFPIQIDFETGNYALGEFVELDHGFDYYAQQSFQDEKGRRIQIGWMGLPDIDYSNPTSQHGWQHALTMPRELYRRNGRIAQRPLTEQYQLRECICAFENPMIDHGCFELQMHIAKCQSFVLSLRQDVTISYDAQNNVCTLAMGKSGYGRDARHVHIHELHALHIFSDTSSLEVFLNDGEESFTTRVYDDFKFHFHCTLSEDDYKGTLWKLRGYHIQQEEAYE